MEEKKHVGRPTNEEVANRKKKKVIKYSLITIESVLLIGGIALFFNRDNIDFSSLMGASIFKRENYVRDKCYYDIDGKRIGECFYQKKFNTSKLNADGYTTCKVSNKKYASCEVGGDELKVFAKKKGNVNIKVYGKDKKGKTVSKTVRIKIGSDFTGPICKISTAPLAKVKRGSTIEATVTCNENVSLTDRAKKDNNRGNWYVDYNIKFSANTKCNTYSSLSKTEKINNKTYKLYYHVPEDACLSNNVRFVVGTHTYKDAAGNINGDEIYSKTFSVVR